MTDTTKPKLSQEEYVRQGGVCCPFCESYDIVGSSVEISAVGASQDVSCSACNASWTDTYKLTGYEADE